MTNQPTLCLIIYFLLATTCPRGADGLQCYYCNYATDASGKPVDGFETDSLCASEHLKGGSNYLVTCNPDNSFGTLEADGKLVRKNYSTAAAAADIAPHQGDDISPKQQKIYGCAKLVGDGERSGDKFKLTERGCIESYIEFKKGCNRKSVKEWKMGDDVWSYVIFTASSTNRGYDDDAVISACYCTGDKCNLTNSRSVGPAFPVLMASGIALLLVIVEKTVIIL